MATLEEKNSKRQFIIALIFISTFLAISAFIFVYGIIKNIDTWASFQPFFTALIGPVGALLGYYFRSYMYEKQNNTNL